MSQRANQDVVVKKLVLCDVKGITVGNKVADSNKRHQDIAYMIMKS